MADAPQSEKPAADETKVGVTPAPEVLKDMPRPISIFRDEAAKTTAVQQSATEERKVVDEKYNTLSKAYAPAMVEFDKQQKVAADERLSVRKETVDKLTKEVGTVENAVAELEKQLEAERAKLWRSQDALYTARDQLYTETGKIAKEQKISRKEKVKALSTDITAAKKERNAVYSKTGKELRHEHWNTFTRTTKESAAYVPDMTFRFGNAARHALGEVFSVFGRSAKKAQEGFTKPTPFSITRDKPLAPQAPKKPEAPAA